VTPSSFINRLHTNAAASRITNAPLVRNPLRDVFFHHEHHHHHHHHNHSHQQAGVVPRRKGQRKCNFLQDDTHRGWLGWLIVCCSPSPHRGFSYSSFYSFSPPVHTEVSFPQWWCWCCCHYHPCRQLLVLLVVLTCCALSFLCHFFAVLAVISIIIIIT